MPDPKVTNIALVRIARDLERLKAEADALPGTDGLLGYLIDMALIEARGQLAEAHG